MLVGLKFSLERRLAQGGEVHENRCDACGRRIGRKGRLIVQRKLCFRRPDDEAIKLCCARVELHYRETSTSAYGMKDEALNPNPEIASSTSRVIPIQLRILLPSNVSQRFIFEAPLLSAIADLQIVQRW